MQGTQSRHTKANLAKEPTTFRIFLGAFDETTGRIFVDCKEDSIFVTQSPDGLDVNSDIKSPVTKTHHLKDLKKLDNLNDF